MGRILILPGDGPSGFGQVIRAMRNYLPCYGWQVVDNERDADLVCLHAGAFIQTDKPVVQVCHGYYWSDYNWPPSILACNDDVVRTSRRADHIIVPSEWVAQPIRRDLRKPVTVIPHGIEIGQFVPSSGHDGYILWGKPRIDEACDPTPVVQLAEKCGDIRFVSTHGKKMDNLTIVSPRPHDEFINLLSRAAVYLSTVRETGDIASREAMALGVPVLSWRHGATAELVRHRINGYLARPGDYDDLISGLRFCIRHRDRLSHAARKTAELYDWKAVIGQYARVFDSLVFDYPVEISIVIPAYNYAHYLPECLDSVYGQRGVSFEVIVVDDGSTDETQAVLHNYPVRVIRQENQGLPAALNAGHRIARGRYILNLDADNTLLPDALRNLLDGMHGDVDIGYGDYVIVGGSSVRTPDVADVDAQLNHINQIPSTCLMRASSIRNLGGYRIRQKRNEDAEFWCRALSAGLVAKRVTDKPVFAYRVHGANKSLVEGGEDVGPRAWNFYYPWRSRSVCRPFGINPRCVPSYHDPKISVIIPCGPGHERYIVDALDSVYGQTFRDFECIVANDTGRDLDLSAIGHGWARVVRTNARNPAGARNAAIRMARAPLIVPLDADDMLYPDTLEMYYKAWTEHPDCIIYADCDTEDADGRLTRYHSGPFSVDRICKQAIYQVTIMFAKSWWEKAGGYDNAPFEDWLFGIKLHFAGIGAVYITQPWGIYRHWPTLSDGQSKNARDYASSSIDKIYACIEELKMACRNCGNKSIVLTNRLPDVRRVICVGDYDGYRSINSRARPGYKYRYCRGTVLDLLPGDEWIAMHADFEPVKEEKTVTAVHVSNAFAPVSDTPRKRKAR